MLFEIDFIGERDKNTYIYVALVFPFATRCLPRTVLESPHSEDSKSIPTKQTG